MVHWIKAPFNFLNRLHVFVVPSSFLSMWDMSMSGVGVLIVFDQEQARRHPLVFLKQRNKWCHKIADVLVIWRSAPHMTIHWRPSRTHQRRGVLSHILSLKFCAVVVSRSWTHSMDRQSSLHEDIYLRSANGYGFCMILLFFHFGKGVFVDVEASRIHSKYF